MAEVDNKGYQDDDGDLSCKSSANEVIQNQIPNGHHKLRYPFRSFYTLNQFIYYNIQFEIVFIWLT